MRSVDEHPRPAVEVFEDTDKGHGRGVLTVTKGGVNMTGANMATASATVTGTLDCNTKKFSGSLVNGVATVLGVPPLPFNGSVAADYVLNPSALANGTMTAMGGLVGNGTWSAAYLGP